MSTVLVVDDSDDVCVVVGASLEAAGYDVICCSGASQARRTLENQAVDVLVLDVMMPNVSGLELLRELRRTSKFSDMPILVLSALGETKDRVTAIKEGADDYLVKPADHEELAARVGRLMLRRRPAQIEGDLGSLDLSQVMQNLSFSGKTGLLMVVEIDNGESRICFDKGAIVGARTPNLAGWDAVYYLLGLKGGRFRFNETEVAQPIDPLETAISLNASLLDLAFFEDELSRRQTLLPSLDQLLKARGELSESLCEAHASLPLRELYEAVAAGSATSIREMISLGSAAPIRVSLTAAILLEHDLFVVLEQKSPYETIQAPRDVDFHLAAFNLFSEYSSNDPSSSAHILIICQDAAWPRLLGLLKQIPEDYLSASRSRLFSQLESLKRGTVRLRDEESQILLNLQILDERPTTKQGQALVNLVSCVLVWLTSREFTNEVAELVDHFCGAPNLRQGVVVVPGDEQDQLAGVVATSGETWSVSNEPPADLEELSKLLVSQGAPPEEVPI